MEKVIRSKRTPETRARSMAYWLESRISTPPIGSGPLCMDRQAVPPSRPFCRSLPVPVGKLCR
jgi:hypothetical protein